jgi:putative ABC transport system permease protein
MLSTGFPLFGNPGATLYTRSDGNVPPVPERKGAPSNEVMPGWFRAAGIPLIAGRDFNEQDVLDHPNVIIISKAGAKMMFGDENPIGKTLLITNRSVPVEIVGVVGDVRSVQLNQANNMEFYRPFAQENYPYLRIVVRSPLPPEAITRSVKTALRGIDPSLALIWPQPFNEIMAHALGQAKLLMVLLGIFAGVALLLATVGIYGAVAYTVEQRTSEIGVRIALGAQTRDVLSLIVNQGMKPVIIGLAIGLASAVALGRLITAQLYQVSAHNPALLGGATVLLATTALFACLVPARRAALVDPVQALRTE